MNQSLQIPALLLVKYIFKRERLVGGIIILSSSLGMILIRRWKSFKMRRNKESSYQMRRVSFYLILWQEQASWNTSRVVSYIKCFSFVWKNWWSYWLTSSRKMSGRYTLNVRSRGKQLVLFSRESLCFPRLRLGKHRDSRENKTNWFP